MRNTSIEAYRQIEEEGLLSKRRSQVYKTLFKHGPCTANELAKHFLGMGFVIPKNINLNIVTRLGELRNLGVVSEVTERPCSVTKKTVIVWDVTPHLPKDFKKPIKTKCPTCKGKGHITEAQMRFFK